MSNFYDWKNNKKIYKKVIELLRKEVALQRLANKMVAT